MDVQELPRAACRSTDKIREHHLVHALDKFADVALDIGLEVAAVEHVAVGEPAAGKPGHGAFPDSFVKLFHVCGSVRLSALLELCEVNGERSGISGPVYFVLRKRCHVKYGDPASEGFLRKLHQSERLRAGQPESTGLCTVIYGDFDIGEQLRRILHLVNEYRQTVRLHEHRRVSPGKSALLEVVKGDILTVVSHKLLQYRGLADLSGSRYQYAGIFPGQGKYPALDITLDVIHAFLLSADIRLNLILARTAVKKQRAGTLCFYFAHLTACVCIVGGAEGN